MINLVVNRKDRKNNNKSLFMMNFKKHIIKRKSIPMHDESRLIHWQKCNSVTDRFAKSRCVYRK